MRAIAYPFKIIENGKVLATNDISKIYLDRALTLVSTLVRQRFMRPAYGVDLGKGMYENSNSYTDGLESAIRSAMSIWLPELNMVEISISDVDESGNVSVTLILSLPNETNIELSYKTVVLSPDGTAAYQGVNNDY